MKKKKDIQNEERDHITEALTTMLLIKKQLLIARSFSNEILRFCHPAQSKGYMKQEQFDTIEKNLSKVNQLIAESLINVWNYIGWMGPVSPVARAELKARLLTWFDDPNHGIMMFKGNTGMYFGLEENEFRDQVLKKLSEITEQLMNLLRINEKNKKNFIFHYYFNYNYCNCYYRCN